LFDFAAPHALATLLHWLYRAELTQHRLQFVDQSVQARAGARGLLGMPHRAAGDDTDLDEVAMNFVGDGILFFRCRRHLRIHLRDTIDGIVDLAEGLTDLTTDIDTGQCPRLSLLHDIH